MNTPNDLKYTKSHEWLKLESEDIAVVGITDYAQDSLGDVVYVELPQVGDTVTEEVEYGAVESVKAASDLVAPLSGTIIEVNEALDDSPELLNDDPYANWVIKVRLETPHKVDLLLNATEYIRFCETE